MLYKCRNCGELSDDLDISRIDAGDEIVCCCPICGSDDVEEADEDDIKPSAYTIYDYIDDFMHDEVRGYDFGF